jgi:hypothetical protein
MALHWGIEKALMMVHLWANSLEYLLVVEMDYLTVVHWVIQLEGHNYNTE